jgi:hypothetical protein
MAAFGSCTMIKWAICGNDEADEEEVNDVEDADTPNDLSTRFGYLPPRVCCFGGSKSCHLGSKKGK